MEKVCIDPAHAVFVQKMRDAPHDETEKVEGLIMSAAEKIMVTDYGDDRHIIREVFNELVKGVNGDMGRRNKTTFTKNNLCYIIDAMVILSSDFKGLPRRGLGRKSKIPRWNDTHSKTGTAVQANP